MKKLLALLLAAVMCFSLVACGNGSNKEEAENIATGDGWIVDSAGTLIISDMDMNKIPDYTYSNPAPWHPYRMLIKAIKIEAGITHIGELAFNSCENAETIEFPDTLEQIADKAFTFCTSLKSITIPDNVAYIGTQAFQGCTALETVTWAESAFSMHQKTFSDCTALKNIEIPEGVAYIQNLVFENCVALEAVTLPDSLKTFEQDSFQGCDALVLKCKAGSAAEEMAEKHNVSYELIVE